MIENKQSMTTVKYFYSNEKMQCLHRFLWSCILLSFCISTVSAQSIKKQYVGLNPNSAPLGSLFRFWRRVLCYCR
jgi:hypothetical protein